MDCNNPRYSVRCVNVHACWYGLVQKAFSSIYINCITYSMVLWWTIFSPKFVLQKTVKIEELVREEEVPVKKRIAHEGARSCPPQVVAPAKQLVNPMLVSSMSLCVLKAFWHPPKNFNKLKSSIPSRSAGLTLFLDLCKIRYNICAVMNHLFLLILMCLVFCLEFNSWDKVSQKWWLFNKIGSFTYEPHCTLVSSEKYVTSMLDECGIVYSVCGCSHPLLALNF
jgi:hypothetical protein